MKSLHFAVTILALGSFGIAGSAQKLLHPRSHSRAKPAGEQLVFSAEDESVREPSNLPDEVKPVLSSDDDVRSLLEEKGIPASKLPATWFSAGRVHLRNRNIDDLIVVGEGPVKGANVTTFWLFTPGANGLQLALKVFSHTLLLKDDRTRGLREIESRSASAVEVFRVSYRYDGLQYKSYREVSEPIK